MQSPQPVISWRIRGVGEIPEVFSCEAYYCPRGRNREGDGIVTSVDYVFCVTNSNAIYIKNPKEDIFIALLTNVHKTLTQHRYPLQ